MRRKIFSPQSRRKTEKEKDENIWSAEEKKNREGKGGKYSEKEKNDGQIDTQTEFSCVDSTPSVEGVEQNVCLLFSQSDHRSNTANFGSVAQGPYVQNIYVA